jgi:hypothetical protein
MGVQTVGSYSMKDSEEIILTKRKDIAIAKLCYTSKQTGAITSQGDSSPKPASRRMELTAQHCTAENRTLKNWSIICSTYTVHS